LVNNTSANIVNNLVTNMNADPYDYTFLHITEPDSAGHSSGWTSAAYGTSLVTVDSRLGQILAMIDDNPALNGRTALVISADHGGGGDPPGGFLGGDRGHFNTESPLNYTIPFYVWGARLPAGGNLYNSMSNRFNPGTGRPTYADPLQPIWNGDGGNLSLALLGLDPIPGSSLIPVLRPVPEPSTLLMAIAGLLTVPLLRRIRHNGVRK
jgi:hypothetical protein